MTCDWEWENLESVEVKGSQHYGVVRREDVPFEFSRCAELCLRTWRQIDSGGFVQTYRHWMVCLLLTVVRIYRHSPVFTFPTHTHSGSYFACCCKITPMINENSKYPCATLTVQLMRQCPWMKNKYVNIGQSNLCNKYCFIVTLDLYNCIFFKD